LKLKKNKGKLTKVFVGRVSVDSGQLMITDPCYLSSWKDNEFMPGTDNDGSYSYDTACKITLNNKFGVIDECRAAVFRSGYGDGTYPVYAYLNSDGRVVKVTVVMK
jgi:hypothetical protein